MRNSIKVLYFINNLELYSEIALSWKPFEVEHMHIQVFASNDGYYDLPENWTFLLELPVYIMM
jgi:hypothetical protein